LAPKELELIRSMPKSSFSSWMAFSMSARVS